MKHIEEMFNEWLKEAKIVPTEEEYKYMLTAFEAGYTIATNAWHEAHSYRKESEA